MSKAISFENLTQYNGLIKSYIESENSKSIKSIVFDEESNTIKFYKTETVEEDTVEDYSITIPTSSNSGESSGGSESGNGNIDTTNFVSKVENAVTDNITVLTSDGGISDSGIAIGDIATKEDVNNISNLVGTIPDGYNSTTVVDYVKEVTNTITTNGYDDTEVRNLIQGNTDNITTLSTDKADKSTTLEGYGITDSYTKTETNSAIETAVNNAEFLRRSVVDTLPDIANANTSTIYIVPIENGSDNQKYEEYILVGDAFEKIGGNSTVVNGGSDGNGDNESGNVDLSDYATINYVDDIKEELTTDITDNTNNIATLTQSVDSLEGVISREVVKGDGVLNAVVISVENYNNLEIKSTTTLYLVTDNGSFTIYLGTMPLNNSGGSSSTQINMSIPTNAARAFSNAITEDDSIIGQGTVTEIEEE